MTPALAHPHLRARCEISAERMNEKAWLRRYSDDIKHWHECLCRGRSGMTELYIKTPKKYFIRPALHGGVSSLTGFQQIQILAC